MSGAAEKLKALEAEALPVPFNYRPGDSEMAALESVRAALPQIVAVVEAAENFGGEWDEMTRGDHKRLERLDTSVAALDEALTVT